MTEEIINSDGTRNWQANILQDQVKRLEEELKQANEDFSCIEKDYRLLNKQINALKQENKELEERFEKRGELMCNCAKQRENYRSALEEIKKEINIKIECIEYEIEHDCFNGIRCKALKEQIEFLNKIEDRINEVLND